VSYTIRPYAPSDAPACLALFDGNTPEYFAPAERGEFAAYLAAPGGGVLVAEAPGAGVVGVGGYYLRASGGPLPEGGLAWGMVARAWHRRGVGRALLRARLDALWRQGAGAASVRTSQHSRGFFERAGFAAARVVPNGFAPGIDLVELRLRAPGLPGPGRAA
jgi:GNAT superfamily N-acetyltransferase